MLILKSHLVSPFVAEVPVKIHAGAKTKCRWIWISVFPPQPVHCVRVLVAEEMKKIMI